MSAAADGTVTRLKHPWKLTEEEAGPLLDVRGEAACGLGLDGGAEGLVACYMRDISFMSSVRGYPACR
jgi:hypothetical protein